MDRKKGLNSPNRLVPDRDMEGRIILYAAPVADTENQKSQENQKSLENQDAVKNISIM